MVSLLYSAVLAASLVSSVSAHGRVTGIKNLRTGTDKSASDVVRGGPNSENPLHRTDGSILMCYNSKKTTKSVVEANPGDQLQFKWDWTTDRHPGPLDTWMAACPSTGCANFAATGAVWFKIQELGPTADVNDFNGGQWASDKLKKDGNKFTITIPQGLKKGEYLIRQNIIAMHLTKKPEFYPSCAHIKIGGGGTGVPTSAQKAAFPDVYTSAEGKKILDFNIFAKYKKSSYKTPGPAAVTSFAKRSLVARDDEPESTDVSEDPAVVEDTEDVEDPEDTEEDTEDSEDTEEDTEDAEEDTEVVEEDTEDVEGAEEDSEDTEDSEDVEDSEGADDSEDTEDVEEPTDDETADPEESEEDESESTEYKRDLSKPFNSGVNVVRNVLRRMNSHGKRRLAANH